MPFTRKHVFAGLVAAGLILTAACGTPTPDESDGAVPGYGQNGSAPAGAAPGAQATQGADNAPSTDEVQAVTIVASDAMRFEPAALTVEAGQPVRITLRNDGSAVHDLSLTQGVSRPVKLVVQPGQSASATFTLARPGTYSFVCAQFGHALAGMKGTITAQ